MIIAAKPEECKGKVHMLGGIGLPYCMVGMQEGKAAILTKNEDEVTCPRCRQIIDVTKGK